ncbi:DUF4145 domain-containing protein [Nocardioides dongxiaopingii]|uniref:DUF4145 domain-containing protein n=1 Tax=Nocardioides dongxiaopingii TaxID=2576036 RepID=UPI0010C76975|nr:DUF4145 domain-containing protein [Nocardioides dongxiaopingii]
MLFEDGAGFCPWHKRDSSFKTVHSVSRASPNFAAPGSTRNVFDENKSHGPQTGVLILQCLHCKESVIVLETVVRMPSNESNGMPTERRWRWMASPAESPRTLHEAAPETIRSLFAEASTCEKAKAFRGAGVMYRATVEELVKDQGATGKDLWHKIENLKGALSDELVQDLHEARMLGNDSIHQGITYSAEEVHDVAELIEEAVLVLYVQPQEKRAMREARKARRSGASAINPDDGGTTTTPPMRV